ncbi:DUF262 domain-containing protein [Haloferax marisrubri]|nr:DUF262 domain-containing protein [Haloferax marisrubri]
MNKQKLWSVLTDQNFNIPDYQRTYSWETKQLKQFWSDVEKFVTAELNDEKQVSDVFFSSMYFAVRGKTRDYEVIDGQQRLTTVHILFKVLNEHLQAIDRDEISDNALIEFKHRGERQLEHILYDPGSISTPSPRLTLNKHDEAFFQALIRDPKQKVAYLTDTADFDIHGNNSNAIQVSTCLDRFGIDDNELNELDTSGLRRSAFFKLFSSHDRLLTTYEFFQERISKLVDGADDADSAVRALLNVSNYIQHSYYIGEYVIRDSDSDFRMQIFEVLNNRGVDLDEIDRIRAAVVNAFFDTDYQEEYVDEKWEQIVVEFATDEDQIIEYLSVYLSIVDDAIEQIGGARNNLTNAFATRAIDSKVRPRLYDLDEAKEFVGDAYELVEYYQHITDPNLEAADLKLAGHREECQDILLRLNSQQMDQWRPLTLALYYYTDASSESQADRFYQFLDTVEKLNFRRLLMSERPNIFQNVFIEAVHNLGLSPSSEDIVSDPYAASIEYLINETRSSNAELFGEQFLVGLAQSKLGSTSTAKLLFRRITNNHFKNEDEYVERRLNADNLHLEHVLPQKPFSSSGDATWLREFFRLNRDDTELTLSIQNYIDLEQRDNLNEQEARLKENMSEFITQQFINDIGNFLLLRGKDNIGASNNPLVEKLPKYHKKSKDFASIYPNRYFTADEGPINRTKLERLLQSHEEPDGDETVTIEEDLREYFNSFWTYESMKDRRVSILVDILETLNFESRPDEFGLASDRERVKQELQDMTADEFERRLSVRSL